jgi:hypothetical protein
MLGILLIDFCKSKDFKKQIPNSKSKFQKTNKFQVQQINFKVPGSTRAKNLYAILALRREFALKKNPPLFAQGWEKLL